MRNLSPNAEWLSSWRCRGRACGGRWRGFANRPDFPQNSCGTAGAPVRIPPDLVIPARPSHPAVFAVSGFKAGNRKACPLKITGGLGNCECRSAAAVAQFKSIGAGIPAQAGSIAGGWLWQLEALARLSSARLNNSHFLRSSAGAPARIPPDLVILGRPPHPADFEASGPEAGNREACPLRAFFGCAV